MIVQGLKVVLEEADVAAKLQAGLAQVSQLKELSLGFLPGAIRVAGKFQVGLAIPFETRWSVDVLPDGRLAVRLVKVSVGFFGMSEASVTAQVMGALAQKLQQVPGVAVQGDALLIEPAVLLSEKGVRLEAPVSRVELQQGRAVIEVG